MKCARTSVSGFINLGLIRLILPIALFWGGGQGLYTALTNRQPHSITFAEYVRTHPDRKWVELTDTRLDVLGAISSGPLGTVSEIYIPMHAPDEPDDTKVSALLKTRDPAMLDLVQQIKAVPNETAMMEFAMKNRERIFPRKTVRGMVQFGIDSESKKRRKIAKLDASLTEDFAVIEDGKEPEIMIAFAIFVAAFPVAWVCWFRSSTPAVGIPAAPGGLPPPLPK